MTDEEQRRANKAAKRARKQAARAAQADIPAEVPIIWVEPTGQISYSGSWKCPNGHRIEREIGFFGVPKESISCEQCGQLAEPWCGSQNEEFIQPATGRLYRSWRELPHGACYASSRDEPHNWVSYLDDAGQPFPEPKKGEGKACRILNRPGPDGRVLIVILPDGHPWTIDSRANNCTLPNDDKHWCWVRTGRPEDGTLDVGKGGLTCAAGAGSIATSRYHGFLRNGVLRRC